MNIFDHFHEQLFDPLFDLDEARRQQLAQLARDSGASEAEVQRLLAPGIQADTTFGAARASDVKSLVERALFREKAASITLKISRWPHDEAGHLDIKVLDVEPAGEEEQ